MSDTQVLSHFGKWILNLSTKKEWRMCIDFKQLKVLEVQGNVYATEINLTALSIIFVFAENCMIIKYIHYFHLGNLS